MMDGMDRWISEITKHVPCKGTHVLGPCVVDNDDDEVGRLGSLAAVAAAATAAAAAPAEAQLPPLHEATRAQETAKDDDDEGTAPAKDSAAPPPPPLRGGAVTSRHGRVVCWGGGVDRV